MSKKYQVATRGTSLDMTTVFHTWLYGRFRATSRKRNFIAVLEIEVM